jgi:hypothetical protein
LCLCGVRVGSYFLCLCGDRVAHIFSLVLVLYVLLLLLLLLLLLCMSSCRVLYAQCYRCLWIVHTWWPGLFGFP